MQIAILLLWNFCKNKFTNTGWSKEEFLEEFKNKIKSRKRRGRGGQRERERNAALKKGGGL